VPLVEAHGERDVLRDFHAYVVGGVEPGISVQNNLETMAACEMMVRSITEGRTVKRSELNS
jgi:predicted dehydrogenase